MNYQLNRLKKKTTDFAFILPALLLFGFAVVLPFFRGITYSFTNWDGLAKTFKYVGLDNYIRIFSDGSILGPIKNSLEYTAITVILDNLAGLLLALALNRAGRAVKVLRTVFFMPFVISLVLAAFIWTYIYSDIFYSLFHIKSLLGNPDTVIFGISIISLWRDTGYVMVIYLAALQSIPVEYYEAARVDGAGVLKRFLAVTFPMIVPALTVNISLFMGWGLKVFDYVMAATKGGPGRASETLAIYVYNYTFPYNRAGYGQAAAILMTLGIFILTSVVTALLKKREVEL